jgi:DNA transformation protein
VTARKRKPRAKGAKPSVGTPMPRAATAPRRGNPADSNFKNFVLEQLEELEGLRAQPMFGGFGLYRGEDFFGIVHGGRLYFRTSAASRGTYIALGMRPFRPNRDQTLQRYYEVPVDVLEDAAELQRWATIASKRDRG